MNSTSFNDSSITRFEDDLYGIGPMAKCIARGIIGIKDPVGTTIAINGSWGVGKTSLVNLVRKEIASHNQKEESSTKKLSVTEFNCFWFRGEDALATAFLNHLSLILGNECATTIKKMAVQLSKFTPLIRGVFNVLPNLPYRSELKTVIDAAEEMLNQKSTMEEMFNGLFEKLNESQNRYLIIIDDMDRLSSKEMLAVFRLLRTVGRLPNLLYLVVFDQNLAKKAVEIEYPSEGRHFLEKIIQASFEVLPPDSFDLKKTIIRGIKEITEQDEYFDERRFNRVMEAVLLKYIRLPRQVVRFQNVIRLTWPAIAHEIDLSDFLAMECIRIYDPEIFSTIAQNKNLLFGYGASIDSVSLRLENLKEEKKNLAKNILGILFPNLWTASWNREAKSYCQEHRRICIEPYFDSYVKMTLSENAISISNIENLIANADNSIMIKEALLYSSSDSVMRRTLEELGNHAAKIDKNKVELLFKTLFEIYDELDKRILDNDSVFDLSLSGLYERLIMRSTKLRFSIDERSEMCFRAIQGASLGWVVRFTADAIHEYEIKDREHLTDDELLLSKEYLPKFIEQALIEINQSKANGRLLGRKDTVSILYAWSKFIKDDSKDVSIWISSLLNDVSALVKLTEAFTGKKYETENDGEKKSSESLQIPKCDSIIDSETFRLAIEKALNRTDIDEKSRSKLSKFIELWDGDSGE